MRSSLVFVLALSLLAVAGVANAADLYSMDMKVCVPAPVGDAAIQVDVHKGHEASNLKGTSTADFIGGVLMNVSCDAIVCVTDAVVVGDELCLYYTANGYKDGKFESDSFFDVTVGGFNTGLDMHTSCSQDIYINHPYTGLPYPSSNFYVLGADGTCDLIDRMGCAPNPYKIQWLLVRFEVPCTNVPTDLTVTLYKDSADFRGQSTGHFDGMELTGVISRGQDNNDPATAMLVGAAVDADGMTVLFKVFGHKGNGEMESSSRFELDVAGCGIFYMDLHTSCSQEIFMNEPYPLEPGGIGTLLNGCGACVGYVPVEDTTWGTIKALYR